MILDRSYFVNDIFLANIADTGPSSNTDGPGLVLDKYIKELEQEALELCLGYKLCKDFLAAFENGILPVSADQKWKDLLNGVEYSDGDETVKWDGLKYSVNEIPKSPLAYYVFFHFLQRGSNTAIGEVRELPKNAEPESYIPKAVRSWNKFHKYIIGSYNQTSYIITHNGVGVDWYGCNSGKRALYQFLWDKKDTYPDWQPTLFEEMNEFGI